MAFLAFGTNIRKEDYNTIRNMMKLVAPDTIEIFDVRVHEATAKSEDIVFIFGKRAEMFCKNLQCKAKLIFPDIDRLSRDLGESEIRQNAKEQLLKFRETLESGALNNLTHNTVYDTQVITEDMIPDFTQLQALEQTLDKQKIDSWIGLTKNGKKIKLTKNPETNTADINLTFAEFYNLRKFMEVFDIKETKIVYKPLATYHKTNS